MWIYHYGSRGILSSCGSIIVEVGPLSPRILSTISQELQGIEGLFRGEQPRSKQLRPHLKRGEEVSGKDSQNNIEKVHLVRLRHHQPLTPPVVSYERSTENAGTQETFLRLCEAP